MAFARLTSMLLRAAQLAFAVIVAAVTGSQLHHSDASSWELARFIYTVVVAGISIFLSLIWLLPFSSTMANYASDVFISLLWFASFGLLVNYAGSSCGAVFDWGNVSPRGDACGKLKANIAFTFLSAIVWLASALVGFFWVRKQERRVVGRSHV